MKTSILNQFETPTLLPRGNIFYKKFFVRWDINLDCRFIQKIQNSWAVNKNSTVKNKSKKNLHKCVKSEQTNVAIPRSLPKKGDPV